MSIKTGFAVVAFGFVIAAFAGQADAQGRGRGQDKPKPKAEAKTESVTVVFRDSDHVTFRDYFVTHKIAAQKLPPGIAMNVQRGKPLPPGIAKRALPQDLVVLVPRPAPNVTYYIVGDRVVALRAGIVIDVMIDIFR